MERKVSTKKRIINIVVALAILAGLLLTMHILVNYFNIVELIKKIHGG